MDPADDLHRMVDQGIWFDSGDNGNAQAQASERQRQGEGEAFRAVWAGMRAQLPQEQVQRDSRMGLRTDIRFVPWDGNVDSWRVGDELEVVFSRAGLGA